MAVRKDSALRKVAGSLGARNGLMAVIHESAQPSGQSFAVDQNRRVIRKGILHQRLSPPPDESTEPLSSAFPAE